VRAALGLSLFERSGTIPCPASNLRRTLYHHANSRDRPRNRRPAAGYRRSPGSAKSMPNEVEMLEDWRVVTAAIWVSGVATWRLFWYPAGRYIDAGLACWVIWVLFVGIVVIRYRTRRQILFASIPVILFVSYGPVFISLMAMPYLIDRLMGRSGI